ncbi:hypothetical protein GCM10017788_60450 [Amycolatopsis acidiphila]|nr:hypothetical protein GCM10017788_60450 [Amycolatopsis acidiphila]
MGRCFGERRRPRAWGSVGRVRDREPGSCTVAGAMTGRVMPVLRGERGRVLLLLAGAVRRLLDVGEVRCQPRHALLDRMGVSPAGRVWR